ncbi:pentapeptide repeat-containing protein [Streptomyces sp. NPDC048696]|uniref:pentapeptide repeat-containing protein n=1 Tax=Streptomyces sp. NPDC048696 TaxID=3365585 RepID=UPI0037108F8C
MNRTLEQRRAWARRRSLARRAGTWLLITVAGVVLCAGLPWLVWKGPYVLDAKYIDKTTIGNGTGSAALVTGLRTALVACVAALGAAIALLYTARNYRLTHRGQVTDRFTKALERLGSTEVYVRIGGILALEQIVQDAPEQATDAARVLGHFLRERAPRARTIAESASPPEVGKSANPLPSEPAGDIQVALTALTRPESRTHVDRREGIDLHGLHLMGANLGGADLTGANLGGATLTIADLGGATLTRANLGGATLTGADLRGVTLTGADLGGATLTRATLRGATLTDTNLGGATLIGADLRGVTLTDTNLGMATLTDADLDGADLTRAYLGDATLTGADLGGATLTRATLRGATLTDAKLGGATLTDADLRGATLTDAYLRGATLTGANLGGATLTRANLRRARLIGAHNLTQDQIDAATVDAETTLPESLSGKPSKKT